MDIPGLGKVTKDDRFGVHCSNPISVAMLGGKACRFVVEGYDEDPAKGDFHIAIANFLSASPAVLKEAEPHIFSYYQDCRVHSPPDDAQPPIKLACDVWVHVRLGGKPIITRRTYGDRGIYVSLECGCDWEKEHGLQIVFKNGQKVTKIGQYDGHLTNSDAFADDSLEDVIYRP